MRLGMLALVIVSLVVLGIMVVYLRNLPETASRTNYWVTVAVGFWIMINLFFEIRDLGKRRDFESVSYSTTPVLFVRSFAQVNLASNPHRRRIPLSSLVNTK